MSEIIVSGPVPRELCAGVVWDAAAEEVYQERAAIHEYKGRMSRADAEQEARWSVEIGLHLAFQKRCILAAARCSTPNQKRALVAEWRSAYGDDRTDRLLVILRDEKLKKKILEAG